MVFYETLIEKGMVVAHSCGKKHCCNFEHMKLIPQGEIRIRENLEKSKCLNGHLNTDENIIYKDGLRLCRLCLVEKTSRYYEKIKEEALHLISLGNKLEKPVWDFCSKGHAMTQDNTSRSFLGYPSCRLCNNINNKKARERKGCNPKVSNEERFHTKYLISDLLFYKETPCWEWQGPLIGGYGMFSIKGKNKMAHRVSYEFFTRIIEQGNVIDHLCRNRCCVNPAHLEQVTQQENVLRGDSPGLAKRRLIEKNECSKGHPLSGDNIRISETKAGGVKRECIICQKERAAIWYQENKERISEKNRGE
jgi:hypothetical protein